MSVSPAKVKLSDISAIWDRALSRLAVCMYKNFPPYTFFIVSSDIYSSNSSPLSSGVSNIITVTTALDSYFEMADVPNYFAFSENKSSDQDIGRTIENASGIPSGL